MPYKDEEKAKEYLKAYHREWRKKNKEKCRLKSIEWRRKNPEKVKQMTKISNQRGRKRKLEWYRKSNYGKKRHLLESYGLTVEQYENIKASQGNICALCGKPLGEKVHLDHDHDNGKIRGFLHPKCNQAIGLLDDDPKMANAALIYLMKHKWQYEFKRNNSHTNCSRPLSRSC